MEENEVARPGSTGRSSDKWWILGLLIVAGILVAWLTFSKSNEVGNKEVPPQPVVLRINSSNVV